MLVLRRVSHDHDYRIYFYGVLSQHRIIVGKVERCGACVRSERCGRTSVANDRVALKNAIVVRRNRP